MLTIFEINENLGGNIDKALSQLEEKEVLIDISCDKDIANVYIVNEKDSKVAKLNKTTLDNNVTYSYKTKRLTDICKDSGREFKELLNILKDYDFFSYDLLIPKDLPSIYEEVHSSLEYNEAVEEYQAEGGSLEFDIDSFDYNKDKANEEVKKHMKKK